MYISLSIDSLDESYCQGVVNGIPVRFRFYGMMSNVTFYHSSFLNSYLGIAGGQVVCLLDSNDFVLTNLDKSSVRVDRKQLDARIEVEIERSVSRPVILNNRAWSLVNVGQKKFLCRQKSFLSMSIAPLLLPQCFYIETTGEF